MNMSTVITKYLLIFCILFSSLRTKAQTNLPIWYDGEAELMDGTMVSGKTYYDLRLQEIVMKTDTGLETFSVYKIKSLTLKNENSEHQFMLVAIKKSNLKPKLHFAELLYLSDIQVSLFRSHSAKRYRTVRDNPSMPMSTFSTVEVTPNLSKDSFQKNNNGLLTRRSTEDFLLDYNGNQFAADRYGVLSAFRK